MRVHRRDGTNQMLPWPPAAKVHPEWNSQMMLYLTVMKRLVSSLGMVLRSNEEQEEEDSQLAETVSGSNNDDEDDGDFVASISSTPSVREWNANLYRGTAYPPRSIPSPPGYEGPVPIIEWWPRKAGSSAPGNVCIRLQGIADARKNKKETSLRRKKRVPVTLVFDAGFRNDTVEAFE
jgi:hypothetical protein